MAEVNTARRDFLRQLGGMAATGAVTAASVGLPAAAWTSEEGRDELRAEMEADSAPAATAKEAEARIQDFKDAERSKALWWAAPTAAGVGAGGAVVGFKGATNHKARSERIQANAEGQYIDPDQLNRGRFSRRGFFRKIGKDMAIAAAGAAAAGVTAATALGTVDGIPQTVLGHRPTKELEQIDKNKKLSKDKRRKFKSWEDWKSWAKRVSFYGAPTGGAIYSVKRFFDLDAEKDTDFLLSEIKKSPGKLAVVEYDDTKGITQVEIRDDSWYRTLPKDNRLRELLVYKYGKHDYHRQAT